MKSLILGGWVDSGGGGFFGFLGSQNVKSGKYDLQRIFKMLTRGCVVENFCVFRGKHFLTSPLEIVTSYVIRGQKSPLPATG